MKTFVGLTSEQFHTVYRIVIPSLQNLYNDVEKARFALYIYLMKLRTNHTHSQIALLFGTTTKVISSRIRAVREAIHQQFVPLHLNNCSRDDILRHTTEFSRQLYRINNDTAVVQFDGTYIYTINSSNYAFQKESFSVQKKRNLVKFMNCVSPDGFIIGTVGPFSARKNDATILDEILNDPNNVLFKNLHPGDVIVLDRGFRDCINVLRRRGFTVKVPTLLTINTTTGQLTRQEANISRETTKTRFVIEVRNGHIKNIWKYLKEVKLYQSLPFLQKDFEIAAALVNAFSSLVHHDKDDWERMAALMAARNGIRNRFNIVIQGIPQSSFINQNKLTLFPKLTYADLKNISQGSYQITQARSYCQMMLANNNGNFPVKVCKASECQRKCASFLTPNSKNALLLLFNLPSRFKAAKRHSTFILLEQNLDDKFMVKEYTCSCKNGLRSVGCCSHVMAVIWYTLYIEHDAHGLPHNLPSKNLMQIFNRN